MLPHEERLKIEKQLGDMIDTSWHYSWHWDRGAYGHLSHKGWEEAHKDGWDQVLELRRELLALEQFMSRVNNIVRENIACDKEQEDANAEPAV